MKAQTDLAGVKAMAKMLLMTEIHESEFSPAIVQHPFTPSGYVLLREKGETRFADITKTLNRLDEEITVYRGVTSYNAKNIRALSWTLDYDKAERFAARYGESGTVYEARIKKERILAYFCSRGESEIIVDPKYLSDIMQAQEPNERMILTQS